MDTHMYTPFMTWCCIHNLDTYTWAANTALLALLAADYGIQSDNYREWGRAQVMERAVWH
jgi:hypothetical protein